MKFVFSLCLLALSGASVFAQFSPPSTPTAKVFASERAKATKGNVDAMCTLGTYYYYGSGTKQNYVAARQWYTKAAAKGNIDAMLMLADIYGEGEGVPKDAAKALDWYKKAASKGSVQAAYDLGAMYEEGDGVAENMTEAVHWYTLAADRGQVDAMVSLGFCYMDGDGVPADSKVGQQWFMKAAQAGDASAMRYLGDYYAQADMGNDCVKAVDWYRKAADAGDSVSVKPVGVLALKGDCAELNNESVAAWMKAKADAGSAEACFYMGGMYLEGVGVAKSAGKGMEMLIRDREIGNYDVAQRNFSTNNLFTLYNSGTLSEAQQKRLFTWFESVAVKQNDDEMMAVLANIYINKENAAGNDFRKGLDWAMKAAEKGNPGGCFWVGFIYYKGLGDIKKDDAKAFTWILKAAQKGDKDAMKLVAEFYEYGTGTPRNPTKAAYWKNKAGVEEAE